MKIKLDTQGYWTDPATGKKWRLCLVEATREMREALSQTIFEEQGSPSDWCGIDEQSAYSVLINAAPIPTIKSRYDWSKIPEGFDWVATDDDGEVWIYSNEPIIPAGYEQWNSNGGAFDRFAQVETCQDWRESLEKRP